MPADLSKSLVIGVSSRALFDLEEANAVFEKSGELAYAEYLLARETEPLREGTGFRLIKAILDLNEKAKHRLDQRGMTRHYRPCEVVVLSKNSPATSYCLFNSIEHHGLDIQRAVLSGGRTLAPYVKAFGVDLYLSAYEEDVRSVLNAGIAAAVIYGTPSEIADPTDQIRIAFDGDAVLFSDEAEQIYKQQGFEAFIAHEKERAIKPLPDGPFARLLRTLSQLQKDEVFEKPPIRTALVTARNMPAHLRVLNTFRAWGVHVDEAFFLGGVPKTKILRAFNPHIFFDDQDAHCRPASGVVSTGRVPYGITSEPPATADPIQSIQAKPTSVIRKKAPKKKPPRNGNKKQSQQ